MKASEKTIYKCDICDKESEWIMGEWISHIYGFGPINLAWEHEFHVCSEKCDKKLTSMTKDQRRKLTQRL